MNWNASLEKSFCDERSLVDLELTIARRADELAAARHARGKWCDVDCWLTAEQEVLRAATLGIDGVAGLRFSRQTTSASEAGSDGPNRSAQNSPIRWERTLPLFTT